MEFGIFTLVTDRSIGIVELARAVEDAGFESLFVGEHPHMPVGTGIGGLAGEDARLPDPFVTLGAAAAVTSRLRLGTGICLVVERDPITLAKEVASLDHLSGGRFLFGIGGGWNARELANHGTDARQRWRILRERVLAMKAIWANDEAEFHGRYVNFDPIWSWPKPVQRPYPPIIMGGNGPRTFARIIEYGDGWMPFGGAIGPDGQWRPARVPTAIHGEAFVEKSRELKQRARDAGRDGITTTLFGGPPDPAALEQYAAGDIDRVLFWLPSGPADLVLPLLERCAKAAARVR